MDKMQALQKVLITQVNHNTMITAAFIEILKTIDPSKRSSSITAVEDLIKHNKEIADLMATFE